MSEVKRMKRVLIVNQDGNEDIYILRNELDELVCEFSVSEGILEVIKVAAPSPDSYKTFGYAGQFKWRTEYRP